MEVVLTPQDYIIMPLITCQVCRRIPSDPSLLVYLCPAGHLYCIECVGVSGVRSISKGKGLGKKCWVVGCNSSLKKIVEPMLRDLHLYSLYACCHNRCKEKVPGQELKIHEDYCHYRPISCPDCRKIVLFEDYLTHLDSAHKIGIGYTSPNEIAQTVSIEFPPADIRGYSVSHYHSFQSESFFIHVIVQPKELFIWVQYYGDIWREQDFSATVYFKGPDGHRAEVTAPISPITTTFPIVQQTKNYAHFSLEMLKCYIKSQPQTQIQSNPTFSSTSSTSSKDKDKDKDNKYVEEDAFSPGLLQFDVIFNYDYLRIFNRNLYHRIVENFGTESTC